MSAPRPWTAQWEGTKGSGLLGRIDPRCRGGWLPLEGHGYRIARRRAHGASSAPDVRSRCVPGCAGPAEAYRVLFGDSRRVHTHALSAFPRTSYVLDYHPKVNAHLATVVDCCAYLKDSPEVIAATLRSVGWTTADPKRRKDLALGLATELRGGVVRELPPDCAVAQFRPPIVRVEADEVVVSYWSGVQRPPRSGYRGVIPRMLRLGIDGTLPRGMPRKVRRQRPPAPPFPSLIGWPTLCVSAMRAVGVNAPLGEITQGLPSLGV